VRAAILVLMKELGETEVGTPRTMRVWMVASAVKSAASSGRLVRPLATPAALTVATGALAKAGVLVTRGHAIETLARADHWIFDKTGTLTLGRPTVVDLRVAEGLDETEVFAQVRALEQASEHPLAKALCEKVGAGETALLTQLRAVTGKGIEARDAEGRAVRIGVPAFVTELHGRPLPEEMAGWLAAGDTVVALGDEAGWRAWFRLSDGLRPGACEALTQLRGLGARLTILSGDAPETVAAVARSLGVEDYRGGMTPEAKHAAVREIQHGGATVAMVGDGVNDAPVLAQAHVSVAMGGGTDLARSQADVVLLSNDLGHLAEGVALARQTLRIIRQNLLWAFAYNLVAIPLAMAGWVTPWMAGIGMSASSLLVVVNALRLQKGRLEWKASIS
jgi:Cu2+-exporting ATPase